MNPREEIASQLAQFLSEEILAGAGDIDHDQNLLLDGVIDSLGMLRLVGFIEVSLSLKVSPDQFTIENFRSINVISDYVVKNRNLEPQ